jgi:hypothetical protein
MSRAGSREAVTKVFSAAPETSALASVGKVWSGNIHHSCRVRDSRATVRSMSTLAEIEAAADALPAEQKQELLVFLATRLRAAGAQMPEPRRFSRQQMAEWIAEDEADMRRFREGQ